MNPSFRKKMYALQQRAALTAPEASFMLAVAGLLLIGFGARHALPPSLPDAEPVHAYADALAALPPPDSSAAPARHGPIETASADSDSTMPPAERPRATRGRLAPVPTNLNTADSRALERLPGIGPALAGRIIEYRELNGPFSRPADVQRVSGIGPRTYERLEPYLRVE